MVEHYKPLTAVWEVTMGCNMRCKHCGSSCAEALEGELTTSQALALIDEMAKFNSIKWITLSGGEPLTRKDLPILIEYLNMHKILPNIVTNGWLLDEDMAYILKKSGVETVAISIDGIEEIHDNIRKPGSFVRVQRAFKNLNDQTIHTSAITAVSKLNIDNLPLLRNELINMNVKAWQIQLGLPMGNFKHHAEHILNPAQIDDIIDFCYETSNMNKLYVHLADSIGYFTKKESEIKRNNFKRNDIQAWNGCHAGIQSFGILHNGDITACTSIRDSDFIEGNVKDKSLSDIWNNPNGFSWRRNLKKSDLKGYCASCTYGDKCLGGCTDLRLTMNGSIYSENTYCSYNRLLQMINIFKKSSV